MRSALVGFSLLALAPLMAESATAAPQGQNSALAPYKAKDYSRLVGMKGFSDLELRTHFKLYEGYVKNVNILLAALNELDQSHQQSTPCYSEMKRHFGWEWDGMRLHEFYFENLGGSGSLDETSSLYKALVSQFGSFESWRADFIATGMMRGVGWVILYQDPKSHRLMNCWITEHDVGHLAGATPLLVMDVWEHAYVFDYGIDRAAYIDAFFKNIDWTTVLNRYQQPQEPQPLLQPPLQPELQPSPQ